MVRNTIHFIKDRLPAIAQMLSLALLISVIALIVTAFIKGRNKAQPPPPHREPPRLTGEVVSIIEGYEYVSTENGREKFRLKADRDTSYSDGRHELEKLTLIAYKPDGKESARVSANQGVWHQQQNNASFTGSVKVTTAEGLEVTTEKLNYDRNTEVATTDVAVQFKRYDVSGSAVGATLYAKDNNLNLLKDAHVICQTVEKDKNGKQVSGLPVELRGAKADYFDKEGWLRFEGNANIVQGVQTATSDIINGIVEPQTHKLNRVELRGQTQQSLLRTLEKGKAAELTAKNMDFFFDEQQRLKQAVATVAAHARSLEKDSPREIKAERIEANYLPSGPEGKDVALNNIITQGRTTLRLAPPEGAAAAKADPAKLAERVIEADAVQANFHPDGKNMARAEANGDAVLTVTPLVVTEKSERKRLRAAKFNAEFFETGNAVKTFIADGNAIAEFEPLLKESKLPKRTLNGKKITADFQQQTQDVSTVTAEGEVKYTDGERHATAQRGVYETASQNVFLRGKPLLWDANARTNADEIDANVETGESLARGRVRTTYFSRETTGGAAPFKKNKAPVTIASDRAHVKHRENVARYLGNARAWQEDDFVRADNLELDKGERVLKAWDNVQSAFYSVEREVEKGKKEIVPIFVSAAQLTYTDETRTAHYEGAVKIRQGTDRIDAEMADAVMDQEHKLSSMTAARQVVLTQPARRGTGEQLVYTAATDAAILTGNLAIVEDRERETTTKGARLTLHLRDARIEADDESGAKRVRTTHRIQR
jgi:lipopolysaccharide export system protein LptA